MNGQLQRRLLLGGALACVGLAAALFWHYAQQPALAATDFEPPPEDICIVPPAQPGQPHPYDPASGRALHAARPIPEQARCPVCGMYPARFKQWAAQLILQDGGAHFFDSAVDLHLFLDDPVRFGSRAQLGDIAALYVSDHGGQGWVDARQASYVAGSDARGPMRGADLPAFAERTAAQAFAAAHGGRVVSFPDIDKALLERLRDNNHSQHMH